MQSDHVKGPRLSGYTLRLILWVSAAVILRIIFFLTFPAFLTNDSWDYLRAAQDIFHRLDFLSGGLRDVRLPGYPVFLALTYPLTGLHSDRIVFVHLLLGMTAVGLGYLLGRQLRSRLVSEILVIFLGLNPVYILLEHSLMTETLFLVSLLAVVTVAMAGLRQNFTWLQAIVLGGLIGLSTLIRVNALPFCMVLVAGVLFFQLKVSVNNTSFISGMKAVGASIVIIGGSILLTLLPWLVRNTFAYGTPSMVNFGNRNILIFATMHEQLDYSLPTVAEVNQEIGATVVDWEWLWKVYHTYGTQGAEEIAREILIEQFSTHPDQYVANVIDGLMGFGGIRNEIGDERTAVQSWLGQLKDVGRLNIEVAAQDSAVTDLDFQYVVAGGDSWFNTIMRDTVAAYLRIGRPLLYVTALGAWIAFVVAYFLRRQPALQQELRTTAVIVVGGAYIVNMLAHSLTMVESDRFALPFDWILVLLLTLVLEVWLGNPRRDTG